MSADPHMIREGWDVLANDGEKVGEVTRIGHEFILVRKGIVFTKDLYVPTTAIASVADGRLYLNHASHEIESMGWEQEPTEDVSAKTSDDAWPTSDEEVGLEVAREREDGA